MTAVLDLVVLTGFLGSGKTTLLRAYLASPGGAGTAVIVNEAGEVGLDGAILSEGARGLPIAMLANGCVCCAVGGELVATIEDLLASLAQAPARIVMETSGLSRPGAILRSLQLRPSVPLRVRVVSTFDALRHVELAGFAEAAAQWAAAQALVLTRQDLCDAAGLAEARQMARSINPLAVLVDEPDRATAFAEALMTDRPVPRLEETTAEHPRITAFLARQSGAMAWDPLAGFLDALAFRLGERLLRVKGLVRLEGDAHPTLVQAVGTLFSPPRPFGGTVETAGLTIITRDTGRGELAALAEGLALEITAPSPFAPRGLGRRALRGDFA